MFNAHMRGLVRDCSKRLNFSQKANLDLLTDPAELALVKMLVSWPKLVESAAIAHEPHRIAFYLVDLASSFHSPGNAGRTNPALRFIVEKMTQ